MLTAALGMLAHRPSVHASLRLSHRPACAKEILVNEPSSSAVQTAARVELGVPERERCVQVRHRSRTGRGAAMAA